MCSKHSPNIAQELTNTEKKKSTCSSEIQISLRVFHFNLVNLVTHCHFWGNSESCKMKEAENRVQVPVLFGFTTYFSSKHNFNLKETFIANKAPCTPSGLLTSRGSFMLPGYYPTCPWSHHFLVLPKGFFVPSPLSANCPSPCPFS